MGAKVNCNPQKLASIVTYLQKSRTAHSIKDLEKQLPSMASINGMQVKDYLQSLQDDNKICVEKIGSGNWYWSFASQDKKTRERALTEAQTAHDKAAAIVEELKEKAAEARAQREDEADALESGGENREDLVAAKSELDKVVKGLQRELAAYSDTDPTELERKKREVGVFRGEAEQYTDEIDAMEGWFRKMGTEEEALKMLRMMMYGDEFDEEEGVLKELF